MTNLVAEIAQFQKFVKDSPPTPEFLWKALGVALTQTVLRAAATLPVPSGFVAHLSQHGYPEEAARDLYRRAIEAAITQPVAEKEPIAV